MCSYAKLNVVRKIADDANWIPLHAAAPGPRTSRQLKETQSPRKSCAPRRGSSPGSGAPASDLRSEGLWASNLNSVSGYFLTN